MRLLFDTTALVANAKNPLRSSTSAAGTRVATLSRGLHSHSPLWCRSLRPQPKATPATYRLGAAGLQILRPANPPGWQQITSNWRERARAETCVRSCARLYAYLQIHGQFVLTASSTRECDALRKISNAVTVFTATPSTLNRNDAFELPAPVARPGLLHGEAQMSVTADGCAVLWRSKPNHWRAITRLDAVFQGIRSKNGVEPAPKIIPWWAWGIFAMIGFKAVKSLIAVMSTAVH